MSKGYLTVILLCSLTAVAKPEQQSATPAATPRPAAAGTPSTCPTAPTAPTITGTLVEGTKEIKGKATAGKPGCPAEIQIFSSTAGAAASMLQLDPAVSPSVGADGTYSVKLQAPLAANQNVVVTEVFSNTITGAGAPSTPTTSSSAVTVQASPSPSPTPSPTPEIPVIAGTLREGANTVTGTVGKLPSGSGGGSCTAQLEVHDTAGDGQLLQLSGGSPRSDVANGGGSFSLLLQEPMRGGQVIRVDEITQNCTGLPNRLQSTATPVTVPGDWGRVKGYFVSGILLSQNQNSFSQSSLFLGFNLDKTWRMPGYYHPRSEPWKSGTEALKTQAMEKQVTAAEKLNAAMGCNQNDTSDCNQVRQAKTLVQNNAMKAKEAEEKSRKAKCEKTNLKQDQKQACDATSAAEMASQQAVSNLSTQTNALYRRVCSKEANLSADQRQACDNARAAQDDAEKTLTEAAKGKTKHPMSWAPGINTFFDVRLTATPVSACNLPNGSSGTNGGSCASPSPSPAPSPAPGGTPAPVPSPTPLDTFLSQRKTARFTVGTYFPFTITTWNYNNRANALFIAPMAKVGFDTPVGDLTQIQTPTTAAPAGATITPTAVNQANFYNFFGYGARIGHYALTNSRSEAPDLVSYLDVIFGPFSNLETLIIPEQGPTIPVKRTRLYRLGLEGILKIPSTPLIIGFSGNIGQESVGLGKHTIVQRAGDDLRFLFGARFDAAKLMSVIAKAAP